MRADLGLWHKIKGFACHRGGNFAVVFCITATALVLGVGFAVDTVQLVNAKSALRAAVDSAVTSTARSITLGDIAEEDAPKTVKAFLTANSTGGLLAYDEIVLDRLTIDNSAKTLEAEAHVDVSLYFPMFSGSNIRRVSNTGAAIYSDRHIEVAMMLDLTGSMAGQKIEDLKKAAKNTVDIFMGYNNPGRPARVRVSLIPYANSVNVGASIGRQAVHIEQSMADRKQAPGNGDPGAVPASSAPYCATERKGSDQYSDAGPEVSMVNRDYLLNFFAQGKEPDGKGIGYAATKPCPDASIVPLTANSKSLTDMIDKFVAEGGTAGHIGVQWTWYMLSNSWKNVVGVAAAAEPYNGKKVGKYAILMTDGEFNLSYFDANTAKAAYNPNGKEQTRLAATTLCGAMRAQGIEIFTIGFQLSNNPNDAAHTTLKECASPDTGGVKHFFSTSTGSQLNDAFMEIARNIENLALTK